MSGTASILYARFYSKESDSYYEENIIPEKINFQTDIREFTGSLDLAYKISSESDLRRVRSNDFVEFFFLLPSGKKHQIGVGFLEDYVRKTTATEMTASFNGRELIAQIMKPPFAKTQHFTAMTLFNFVDSAVKGEYVGQYCKFKNISPVLGIQNYKEKMRMSTDLTQTKGALIQQYADLAINLVYQNRLGQVVIYGGKNLNDSLGVLKKGHNVLDMEVKGSYSKAISEVVTFFSSAQADLDSNKINSPTILNKDQRVRGKIYNPTYRTFSSNDLQVFSVTPDVRIKQIANSILRQSNSNLSPVIVSVDRPYYLEEGEAIAYECGQVWTLVSDIEEFETSEYPNGTSKVSMILAGIHYGQDEGSLSLQLLFVEKGTLT